MNSKEIVKDSKYDEKQPSYFKEEHIEEILNEEEYDEDEFDFIRSTN
jgi:hypothetical protein